MQNLYDPLPDAVEVSGRSFPITTDFRDWLKYDAMLQDDSMDDSAKIPTPAAAAANNYSTTINNFSDSAPAVQPAQGNVVLRDEQTIVVHNEIDGEVLYTKMKKVERERGIDLGGKGFYDR